MVQLATKSLHLWSSETCLCCIQLWSSGPSALQGAQLGLHCRGLSIEEEGCVFGAWCGPCDRSSLMLPFHFLCWSVSLKTKHMILYNRTKQKDVEERHQNVMMLLNPKGYWSLHLMQVSGTLSMWKMHSAKNLIHPLTPMLKAQANGSYCWVVNSELEELRIQSSVSPAWKDLAHYKLGLDFYVLVKVIGFAQMRVCSHLFHYSAWHSSSFTSKPYIQGLEMGDVLLTSPRA